MRTRVVIAGVVAATLLAAPAAPAGEPADRRTQREVSTLLNLAHRQVYRDDSSCRPRPFPRRPRKPALTDADPSATFTSILSIYRRAPTAAELGVVEDRLGPFGMEMPGVEEVYRRGVRIVRSHAGEIFTIRIASRVRRISPFDPATRERCQAAIRARLDDFDRPRSIVRAARKILVEGQEQEARYLAETPEVGEGMAVSMQLRGRHAGGGGGGMFNPAEFRARGSWTSTIHGHPRRPRTTFGGLVPDGVATIDFEYPGRTITAAVRDNVVSVTAARGSRNGFPRRMVWRGPDGTPVNVVRLGAR